MKTGRGSLSFNYGDHEMVEATLWEHDETKEFSVSIDDPFDGFTKSKDIKRLGEQLIRWSERMKRRGQ